MLVGRIRFHRVSFMVMLLVFSGSPESRTQHYAVISRVRATGPRLPLANVVVDPVGMAGLEPASPCSQSTWVRRYPTSRHGNQNGRIRTADLLAPSQARCQPSLRSAVSGPYGSRTHLPGLKGRCPRTDRRTSHHGRAPSTQLNHGVGAQLSRSGSGGARIRVCGFSGRRYTISATDPNEKSPMSL